MKKKLKVKANPLFNGMVTNFEAMDAKVRRFVGWKWDAKVGEQGAWVQVETPEIVPYRVEYVQALRSGELLAADNDTAKLVGVSFIK